MKLLKHSLFCLSLTVVVTACSDDNPWNTYGEGEGGIVPKVSTDAYVKDAIPTRATALAPAVDQFGLRLTRKSGGFSQKWNSVNDFPLDKSFAAGTYTMEAFYGTPSDEGYNMPYYTGSTTFAIVAGETSEVSVTAQLANTMVDVSYTEAFRNYFSSYSTTLHSEGHGYHQLLSSIDDPVYLVPGKVTVSLDFTKPNGQSATIQPAEFTAQARHYYHITLDVNNGGVGGAALVVKFDDSVQTEDVEIDLSDQLLNISGPEVTTKGFVHNQTINALTGIPYSGQAAFTAYAPGHISSAKLTINSDSYSPAFGNEVELANADAATQQQLEDAGIKVLGLYKNPEAMATVDIAGLIGNLPQGTHEITLVTKDQLTRVNEPVTVKIVNEPVALTFGSAPEVAFGASEATIYVNYNGDNLAKNLTVKGLADNGALVDCPVKSVAAAATTRSDNFPMKSYKVELEIPTTTRDLDVRLFCHGTLTDDKGFVPIAIPNYTFTTNDWARKSVLKVNGYSGNILASIVANLRFFNTTSGNEIDSQYITRDIENGEITISGLNPDSHYTLATTTRLGANPAKGATVEFTTEKALQPENANMNNWYSEQVYSHSTTVLFIKVGEDIYRWFPNAQGTSYWATRNETTTSQTSGTTCFYTSYSGTYSVAGRTNKAAQICTIGWGEGSTYSTASGGGTCNDITAGMLFMGKHTYTGSNHFDASQETFEFGQPFASRPVAFSFYYTFTPYNNENFKAYAVVENRSGGKVTELGRGELEGGLEVSEFTQVSVPITYTNTSLKATHAYIVFISSTAENPTVHALTGSKNAGAGFADSRRIGNVLTVDDIAFQY